MKNQYCHQLQKGIFFLYYIHVDPFQNISTRWQGGWLNLPDLANQDTVTSSLRSVYHIFTLLSCNVYYALPHMLSDNL